MTAFRELAEDPGALLMIALSFLLLFLGIKKRYEPLLLVPIAFGVLLANFPGGHMNVVSSYSDKAIMEMTLVQIASEYGIMNMLYYALIKTGLLPPLIFMGVGAMTDFGPMLRNLRLAFFGAAAQLGIFIVLISAVALGRHLKVREYVADGVIAVTHVATVDNAADIFTKPLEAAPFNKHRVFLMPRDCE